MKVLKNEIQAKDRSLSVETSFDLSDNSCSRDQSFLADDYTLSPLVNSPPYAIKKTMCLFSNDAFQSYYDLFQVN